MIGEQGNSLSLQQGNIRVKLLISEDDPPLAEPFHCFQRRSELRAYDAAPRVQFSAFLLRQNAVAECPCHLIYRPSGYIGVEENAAILAHRNVNTLMYGKSAEHGGKLRTRDSAFPVDESVSVTVHNPGAFRPNSGVSIFCSRSVGKRDGLNYNGRTLFLIERKNHIAPLHKRVPAVRCADWQYQSKHEQECFHFFVNPHR